MNWDTALPYIANVPGGFAMAIAIWALVSNKVSLPREVQTWKGLYDEAKKDLGESEETIKTLTTNLGRQNDSHVDTIELLKGFVRQAGGPKV